MTDKNFESNLNFGENLFLIDMMIEENEVECKPIVVYYSDNLKINR